MDQGRWLSRRADRNFANNLMNARSCFQKAQGLLSPESPSGRAELAAVEYQLLNAEFYIAFNSAMTPEEKLSHLQTAEQHSWNTADYARQSGENRREAPALLLQSELYRAVIKGRRAEIHERLQVSAEATRRQKDDAMSGITIAMEKIRELAPANLHESEKFANTWTERLKPQLPQSNAFNGSDISIRPPRENAVELEVSGRTTATPLPTYSELSFAGRPPPPYAPT